MGDFHEPDWKTLRALQPVLLERLCTRILDELRGVMDDASMTAHQRYLALTSCWTSETTTWRRDSTTCAAPGPLCGWRTSTRWGCSRTRELERFTPQTRDSFVGIAEIYRDASSRQRR